MRCGTATTRPAFTGKHFAMPDITNNPRSLATPHPRIMVCGTGPRKSLRMVAQYADACNVGEWVGADNMRTAIDTLKAQCEAVGRDYAVVEKICLCTVHLSGKDTVAGVI